MDYFAEAERVLKSYAGLKRALPNLLRRKQRIEDMGKPRDIPAISTDSGYISHTSFNDTMADLVALNFVCKDIAKTKQLIQEIETAVLQMSESKKQLITLWYFENRTKEDICEIIGKYSTSTVYEMRNRAVAEFALFYFGAGAIDLI